MIYKRKITDRFEKKVLNVSNSWLEIMKSYEIMKNYEIMKPWKVMKLWYHRSWITVKRTLWWQSWNWQCKLYNRRHFQFQLCQERVLFKSVLTFVVYRLLLKKLSFRYLVHHIIKLLTSCIEKYGLPMQRKVL